MQITKQPLLSMGQAARLLGRHIDTLHQWRRKGLLECVRVGSWWYTTEAALQAMARVDGPMPKLASGIDRVAHERAKAELRKMGVKC